MTVMDADGQQRGISVHVTTRFEGTSIATDVLAPLVRAICKRFGVAKAKIEIAVVDDDEIRRLNHRFLGRDDSTDCLSFDLSEGKSTRQFEIVVNGPRAVEEARLRGHSAEAELALYVTHGLLHNLGFDDAEPQQAEEMHRVEDEILQSQGFGCVYNSQAKPETRE